MFAMKTICIEGNIGSGKSTVVESAKIHFPEFSFYSEPVNEWTNFHGYNMLDLLYGDKDKYGLSFQLMAYNSLKKIQSTYNPGFRVLQRSLETVVFCFTKLKVKLGHINECQEWILRDMYESDTFHPIDHVLYLKTDPVTCFERMKARGRDEEKTVSFDYLEKLHETYEEFIRDHRAPVIVLDGNLSKEELADSVFRECKKIKALYPSENHSMVL